VFLSLKKIHHKLKSRMRKRSRKRRFKEKERYTFLYLHQWRAVHGSKGSNASLVKKRKEKKSYINNSI
jgi:hypothetical protein